LESDRIVSAERLASPSTNGKLRIAHLSPMRGGVANAALRLHQGLLKAGAPSELYMSSVPAGAQAEAHLYPFPPSNRLLHYADAASKLVNTYFGLTGLTNVSSRFWSFPQTDVIHLHGAADRWFNLAVLKNLGHHRPIIWTMHDQHLGTGGCGYPEEWEQCDHWRSGCGDCPFARHEGWWLDLTRQTFSRKKAILESLPTMAVVSPSQWMLDFTASSAITRNQILRRIPHGIDTGQFSPYPMAEARRELGLPPDAKLLLSVATKLGQPRKGMQYYPSLLKNLRELNPDKNLGVVLVGAQLPASMLDELNSYVPTYHLGHIDGSAQLAKVYSAADCFVILSRIESFGLVVLESLSCGTPAAGFRVGGIPDMIQPGETGVLAELGDTHGLAAGISQLLNDSAALERMRILARKKAVEEFSLEMQAERHIALYQELADSLRIPSKADAPALRTKQS
jgi:glycosyltransferase involved in cell wall biosynthesis